MSKNWEIRQTEDGDTDALYPHLSDETLYELAFGQAHMDTRWALDESVRISRERYTVVVDDEVGGVFGVAVGESADGVTIGAPWFIGRDDLMAKVTYSFLVNSKAFVQQWKEDYGTLANWVPAAHEKSIRWLKFLGFVFLDPHPTFPAFVGFGLSKE